MVADMHTSPMEPNSIRIPPKATYVPRPAAPVGVAPRKPIRSIDNGVRESKKPESALRGVRLRQMWWERRSLQWCWVTNSLAELSSDLVLGRKVDLLEELGRDGQAARSADLPQRIVCIVIAVQMISRACTSIVSVVVARSSANAYHSRSPSQGAGRHYLDRVPPTS